MDWSKSDLTESEKQLLARMSDLALNRLQDLRDMMHADLIAVRAKIISDLETSLRQGIPPIYSMYDQPPFPLSAFHPLLERMIYWQISINATVDSLNKQGHASDPRIVEKLTDLDEFIEGRVVEMEKRVAAYNSSETEANAAMAAKNHEAWIRYNDAIRLLRKLRRR